MAGVRSIWWGALWLAVVAIFGDWENDVGFAGDSRTDETDT